MAAAGIDCDGAGGVVQRGRERGGCSRALMGTGAKSLRGGVPQNRQLAQTEGIGDENSTAAGMPSRIPLGCGAYLEHVREISTGVRE